MPISVKCGCGQSFKAKDELAGRTVKCPKCAKPIAIPGGAAKPATTKAAAPSAAAPSGPKELSLDDLALLDASSSGLQPAGMSGVMQPAGQPQMQAGGFQAAGFQQGGFQAGGFQQPGFQQGGFAFGQAAPQKASGGKGKVIALVAAGGAAVIAIVVAVILMLGDDEKPNLSEKTGTDPSGPVGPGPPPGFVGPGTAPPTVPPTGGPGTQTQTNPGGGAPDGEIRHQSLQKVQSTPPGQPLVVPGGFSISTPAADFGWSFATEQTVEAITATSYVCRQNQQGAQNLVTVTVDPRTLSGQPNRAAYLKGNYNGFVSAAAAQGLQNVEGQQPSVEPPIPDRVEFSLAAVSGGRQVYLRYATIFKKYTYVIQVFAFSSEEANRLFAVVDSLKELDSTSTEPPPTGTVAGTTNGMGTPASGGKSMASALAQWHKQQKPILGMKYVEGEDPEQIRKQACFSWMCDLLPYLGHEAEYAKFDYKQPCWVPPNREIGGLVLDQFLNPANQRRTATRPEVDEFGLTHFVGMSGVEIERNDTAAMFPRSHPQAGVFGYGEIARIAEITDGASQTIMVIGSDGDCAEPWIGAGGGTIRGARIGPDGTYFDELGGSMFGLQGLSQPGTLALMVDGSVRMVPKSIDPKVFAAMCTIHGAETVDLNAAPVSDQTVGGVK